MITNINYTAEPTLARFHADNSFVRGVRGPIGSGKSVGCCIEILRRALEQRPNAAKVRRSRWAVIRNTYPELKTTTIKTWQDWVPSELCPIKYDAPITGRMVEPMSDGTTVDLEIIFLALDRPDDEKKLLSLELTGAWINEARELPKRIVDAVTSRVGRFPSMRDGGASWSGVIMDTNSPDDLHWWFKMAEEEHPAGWNFYTQPGALLKLPNGQYVPNPAAENIKNHALGYDYYLRQIPGKDPDWIRVMILGEYGSLFDGKPVYLDIYKDAFHASDKPLAIIPGIPLRLGFDFGLTPACIVGQLSPKGQLRILREYVCERGGIRQFATDVVKPALINEFPGLTVISTGDPAGTQKSQVDETSCIEELGRLGIQTEPAATNEFLARRQAVCSCLTRMIGGEPAFVLDPSCRMLRRGFNGGYNFELIQQVLKGGELRHKEAPAKNQFSHPHDALQYLCLQVDPDRLNSHVQTRQIIEKAMRSGMSAGGGRGMNDYNPFA